MYSIKTDGSGKQKLGDDPISPASLAINVTGDWIYYGNHSDNDKLYKIKTDGSGRQKLSDDPVKNIFIANNRIYANLGYIENVCLYTMNTNGTDRQLVN